MLVNERLATQQLTSGAKTGISYMRLSETGLQLVTEPFFKSLLVALYKDRMQNLLTRARILLPPGEARLMIGVMDETGTLLPGEVRVKACHNQRLGSAFDDLDPRLSLLCHVGGDAIHPCKICGGCQIRVPRSIHSYMQSTLSHIISIPICIRSAFFLRRTK